MVLLKTKKELKTIALHKKVCAMYQELNNAYPDAPSYRICHTIAAELSMTPQGVRNILVKNKVYEPRRD